MKKLMYIFLVLSVLTGCKEKKDAGAMKGMPTLAISVAKPIVKDITLTKDYPGYLTTEKSCGQSERNITVCLLRTGWTGKKRAVAVCNRTYLI